jgi:hypothetical protein
MRVRPPLLSSERPALATFTDVASGRAAAMPRATSLLETDKGSRTIVAPSEGSPFSSDTRPMRLTASWLTACSGVRARQDVRSDQPLAGSRADRVPASSLLLTAGAGRRWSRAAAPFLDPDLDRWGLDLIWRNGPRCHRNRFYRRATSQNRVCRTIRAPRAVRRAPMILTRFAFARRRLW